ncbi:hypothetical protein HW560_22275 [Paenibacillus sp. E222]|uniref:hypothetical protein n=1 Tax=Paenibacillus sp. E222 TaxID=2748863 RepID=UPI0015C66C30|nr:hypothetical protein [Paenibacillus sp. E222]QLG40556.1 hypothetical protein HW560_22275 [Paenibacillus sp. E222]
MINELKEKIYHHKTKSYFGEIVSSIENGNYRSAVVVLYSVVVCDLVFKLMDLRDIHNDLKAYKILSDLNVEKEDSPVSSTWETNLIEKSFKEAKLLENDVYTHIITLKNYRNLAAHPVINSIDILFEPSKELVETLTLNMLNGLLIKSPIFTKNVFVPFLEEIERIKSEFVETERLIKYIKSKYLQHFNKELTEYVFKNLWKMVFRNEGPRETKNREINFKVLTIIYEHNEEVLFTYFRNEQSFFSEFLDKEMILSKLFDFFTIFPNVYVQLSNHAIEILRNRAKSNHNLMIKSYFMSDSIEKHFDLIESSLWQVGEYYNQPYTHMYQLQIDEIRFLYQLAVDNQVIWKFNDTMISYYIHSGHYRAADFAYDLCIEPYYVNFTIDQFRTLLKGSHSNEQCHGNRYSNSRYRRLLEEVTSQYGKIEDLEKDYPEFFQ